MENESDDVSNIHNRFSLTLVNPGSHYFSLAASLGVGLVIVLATYLGNLNNLNLEEFWYRIPMVLGVNSPKIVQLKEASKYNAEFEIFPNLVVSATTINKIAQQIHYIINKNLEGIFHLSSNDMIHHSELFYEITDKLGLKNVIFKKIYSSNKDSYLAILPKQNLLPKNYQITLNEIIDDCVLQEAIDSVKE